MIKRVAVEGSDTSKNQTVDQHLSQVAQALGEERLVLIVELEKPGRLLNALRAISQHDKVIQVPV